MQVAAGLGERTEQVIFTQTGTSRAGGLKSRSSVKGKEDSKFRRLFHDLARDEKDKVKERPQVNEDLWPQLMLLNPELSMLSLDQGVVSADEAELLSAVQAGGGNLLELVPEAEVPTEATLEEAVATDTGIVAQSLSAEAADNENIMDKVEPQPLTILDGNGPETPVHSTAETIAVQGGVENAPSQQHKDFAVEAPARIPVQASANVQSQTELKDAETAEMAEPVMTAGIAETQGGAETTGVKTANAAGTLEDLQTEVDATGTETAGRAGRVETARQRVFPEETGDRDGFEELFDTAEHEVKTAFKREEPRINGELFNETFNQVVGEAPIREQNPEATAVTPEPFIPENAREGLATQIVRGARLMVKDGMTKIQIQLEPAELGKLELSLVVERDLVAARFVTETQGVQSLIESNLPELRSALEEAGLQVDLLQVGVQTGTDSQMPNQNMTGGEQFKRNLGWKPTADMFVAEEPIFGEEAWHGMVNLRI